MRKSRFHSCACVKTAIALQKYFYYCVLRAQAWVLSSQPILSKPNRRVHDRGQSRPPFISPGQILHEYNPNTEPDQTVFPKLVLRMYFGSMNLIMVWILSYSFFFQTILDSERFTFNTGLLGFIAQLTVVLFKNHVAEYKIKSNRRLITGSQSTDRRTCHGMCDIPIFGCDRPRNRL